MRPGFWWTAIAVAVTILLGLLCCAMRPRPVFADDLSSEGGC